MAIRGQPGIVKARKSLPPTGSQSSSSLEENTNKFMEKIERAMKMSMEGDQKKGGRQEQE